MVDKIFTKTAAFNFCLRLWFFRRPGHDQTGVPLWPHAFKTGASIGTLFNYFAGTSGLFFKFISFFGNNNDAPILTVNITRMIKSELPVVSPILST